MKKINFVVAIAAIFLLAGCVKTDGFDENDEIGMEEIQGKYSVVSSTCPFIFSESSFEVSESGAIVAMDDGFTGGVNEGSEADPSELEEELGVGSSYPLYISSTEGAVDSEIAPVKAADTVQNPPPISGNISISGNEITATISHAGITDSCRVTKIDSGAIIKCGDADCTIQAQRRANTEDTPGMVNEEPPASTVGMEDSSMGEQVSEEGPVLEEAPVIEAIDE